MKILSDAEEKSLEKIAGLRALCGKYRRAISEARNVLLRHEHMTPKLGFPVDALTILSRALEEKLP